ncbi:MAG: hypothetical protein ABR522_06505 [Marinobacter sp.]
MINYFHNIPWNLERGGAQAIANALGDFVNAPSDSDHPQARGHSGIH